jgi:type IV secretory pathway TrbL component
MPLRKISDTGKKAFNAAGNAARATRIAAFNGAKFSAQFTAKATGTGIRKTLDGIESVDKKIENADKLVESTLGKSGRKVAGVFGEEAATQGERAGRLSYRGMKWGINLLPIPPALTKAAEALRHFRRK